jgi:integrase
VLPQAGSLPGPVFSQAARAAKPRRHSGIPTLFGQGQKGIRDQPVGGDDLLRFLYGVALQRERFIEMLPMPRKEHYLPLILSPAEVLRFLEAAPSFTYRVIFSTIYGTGRRVSEAVHLRMRHMDSQRMMIRIEQSKGNRDRDVPLSPKLLELLRTYWRKGSTAGMAFPRTEF